MGILGLSDKQLNFCREYVKDFNGTQAAIRAGYSKNGASVQATTLLGNPKIQERISTLANNAAEKQEVTAERIIAEFAKIAFSSIAHMHNSWITRKEFDELTDDQKDCIESIKTRTRREFDKVINKPVEIEEIHIKLYDKQRALENLGKYVGIYERDNGQKSININFGTEDESL